MRVVAYTENAHIGQSGLKSAEVHGWDSIEAK